MSSARDRVINRLNQQLGAGTDRLSQSRHLIDHYKSVFSGMHTKVRYIYIFKQLPANTISFSS